jgi:CrcB protein
VRLADRDDSRGRTGRHGGTSGPHGTRATGGPGRTGRPTVDADVLAVIGAGGALGSLARWAVSSALPYGNGDLAWATLVVNVTGSLLLGVLMALVLGPWAARRYVRPFLGVGVLGGYTTFSTYELDARGLLAAGHPAVALAYLLGSVLAGLAAIAVGLAAGRALVSGSRGAGTAGDVR